MTEEQRTRYRLALLAQLAASSPWPMGLDSLNTGMVLAGFRDSGHDDVLREAKAMEQSGWIKMGRNEVNRSQVEIELMEAGRVALKDKGL